MTDDKRCKSTYSYVEGHIHYCDLFDGHDGPHTSIYQWDEEESDP